MDDGDLDRLKNEGFVVDHDGFVNVFTDGSCEGNGQKGGSDSYVF